MLVLLVCSPTSPIGERQVAVSAFIWHFARMDSLVLSHQNTSSKWLSTHKTAVRFFTRMSSNVFQQGVAFDVGSTAHIAFVRFVYTMTFHMHLEYAVRKEGHRAQCTLYSFVSFVVASMLIEFIVRVKFSVTYLAGIWFTCGMCSAVLNETEVIDWD